MGMPLAYEFSKYFEVIGFDINRKRINQLKLGIDRNHQINKKNLKTCKINFTNDSSLIRDVNYFIVTVPTPIKINKKPDLGPLIKATKILSKKLKKNSVIVYESTVYPGLTEEVLIPFIEKFSKFKLNKDFFVGYSPERISPGVKSKDLTNITKIVSGSSPIALKKIKFLYNKIIKSGLYETPNIKTAEAAKILENMQRDLNISLINEASVIFDKLKINTFDVLKAANTKWNFINIEPGLVGGHCISVDPYYLKYKSEQVGYVPNVISSGRKINENMALFISRKVKKSLDNMNGKKMSSSKYKLGIMGLSFKENCGDIRNSQVFKIIQYFKNKNFILEVVDPQVSTNELNEKFLKKIFVKKFTKKLDCLIITVKHNNFIKLKDDYYLKLMNKNSLIFDVKNILKKRNLKDIKILTL